MPETGTTRVGALAAHFGPDIGLGATLGGYLGTSATSSPTPSITSRVLQRWRPPLVVDPIAAQAHLELYRSLP